MDGIQPEGYPICICDKSNQLNALRNRPTGDVSNLTSQRTMAYRLHGHQHRPQVPAVM